MNAKRADAPAEQQPDPHLTQMPSTQYQTTYEQTSDNSDLYEAEKPEQFSGISPQMLEKYDFIKEIGHGTQGHVYEARRKSDNAHVAIKKLDIASVSTWKEYELFNREATALAQINIEGTAHFYEAVECLNDEHPSAYIVQEFIEGQSLSELLKENYRFSNAQIFDAALQLFDILENLHTRNPPIIHRDIKPSNVILSPRDNGFFRVCLIDFGAISNPQIQSGGSTVAGTYGYMPPEQLMGKPEPASDIYALGALLAHWLSGVDPADMQVADFRLLIEPHLEHLPHHIVSTLRNMLTPAVSNRFCDYTLLRDAFTSFLKDKATDAPKTDDIQLSSNLEERFKEVKTLGQTGNIELWHSLSENTPRKLPLCYQNLKITRHNNTATLVDEKPSFDERFVDSNYPSDLPKNLAIIYSILFGGTLLSIFLFAKLEILHAAGIILGIFALIIFSLILPIIIRKIIKKLNRSQRKAKKVIQNLLRYGRKSIATITKIEYQLLNKDHLEICPSDREGKLLYYDGLPIFVVSYKFNPPDDASQNDIIHQIILHSSPEGRIKVGDPLPILYQIHEKDNRIVSSMPVPIALSDIVDLREIICTTAQ